MSDKDENEFWTAWQILDPLLPTGGFAHSNGLEAALQFGFMNNCGDDVSSFVDDIARNACSALGPFVLSARKRFSQKEMKDDDILKWCRENEKLHAMFAGNAPARRASIATGRALCRAAVAAFSNDSTAVCARLKSLKRVSRPNSRIGHLACVFGAICGILAISEKISIRMFLYVTVRDSCSAATRLNVVGPLEVAAILRKSTKMMEKLCEDAINNGDCVDDAAVTAPLAEIFAAAHDGLDGRLFNS